MKDLSQIDPELQARVQARFDPIRQRTGFDACMDRIQAALAESKRPSPEDIAIVEPVIDEARAEVSRLQRQDPYQARQVVRALMGTVFR